MKWDRAVWRKSRQLAFWYEDLAKRIGCSFLDAGAIDGIRMHPNDYMHLDKKAMSFWRVRWLS